MRPRGPSRRPTEPPIALMDTLRYTVGFLLGIVLPLRLQRWDRSHLRPDRRAGTWNRVSWSAALYAFGPFSMIGWVWGAGLTLM